MNQTAMKSDAKRIYDSPDYKRSRGAYSAQCAFEYFISILAADAYLAKLLNYIGISDDIIGIISSLIAASFLFQLVSIAMVRRIKSTKRTGTIFNMLSSVLFVGLYFIPFLPFNKTVKTVLVIVCILAAYFCNYSVTSIIYKWGNSFVDPNKRGDYSAGKEMVSLISGMAFTLFVGMMVDRYEAAGELEKSFLFIACAGLIVSVCTFISLMLIKSDEGNHTKTPSVPLSEVWKNTFGNPNFRNIVIMTVLWDVSRYLTIGFLGTYKTQELMFSVGTVQIINIVGNGFRFIVSKPFGRYSDRTSYAHGIEIALCIAATAFAFNMFASPSSRWCIIVYTILFAVSIAGTNQNSHNILYSYVDAKYFVQAAAIKNSIGGVIAFFASLVGSRILKAVQANGNTVFGLPIYGQQLLSAMSLVVIIGGILFVHFVIGKQKIMKQ